jgi:ATP-dependent Lon protease
MVKLLYPDLKMTNEEAYELVDFAAEGRKRVKDQLYIIDETFKAEPAIFKYTNIKTGEEVHVETLERLSNPLIVPVYSPQPVDSSLCDSDAKPLGINNDVKGAETKDESQEDKSVLARRPRLPLLTEKSLSFRMGQTGVSYEKLFAPYLENAGEITVEDPYIRAPWQIKNFMEFVTMLIDTRPVDDLKLKLVTNEDEEKIPDLIDRLDDIKDDLAGYGIDFVYELRDFHDRSIKTDEGWTITLGRGLDIFEKYNTYSIAASRQSVRKCKDFMVTFMKTEECKPHAKQNI